MKTVFMAFTLLMVSFSAISQNKNQKAEIEVNGVCNMCKERIEKAAIRTKGVKSAVWDVHTHQLAIIFDENKTSIKQIENQVAGVGHDTENFTAPQEVYEQLHACCKYRDEEVI